MPVEPLAPLAFASCLFSLLIGVAIGRLTLTDRRGVRGALDL